jgi:hypothetical protein
MRPYRLQQLEYLVGVGGERRRNGRTLFQQCKKLAEARYFLANRCSNITCSS